jgi:hypothetical protein
MSVVWRLSFPSVLIGALFNTLGTANADQTLICTSRAGDLSSVSLLIKGPTDAPVQILWPDSGTNRTFAIKDHFDAHYAATELELDSQDLSGQIYINRLDGGLIVENYISDRARQVLVRLCDARSYTSGEPTLT